MIGFSYIEIAFIVHGKVKNDRIFSFFFGRQEDLRPDVPRPSVRTCSMIIVAIFFALCSQSRIAMW
jgi:hypothetical protein